MADVFATIIVTAAQAQAARDAAATIPGGEGMFTTGLSSTGQEPATHFISSGTVPQEIVEVITDLAEVSELPPAEAMQAAGLMLCAPSD
jgi:hypothetical protein